VRDEQTHPHRPGLVDSHSTCPPLSSPPHANSFVIGPAAIKHTLARAQKLESPGLRDLEKGVGAYLFKVQRLAHVLTGRRYVYVCMYVCMHVCMYVCMCVCVCVCVCVYS
jgi:hypothetical protein